MMNDKFLIIGGSGYIGSALTNTILSKYQNSNVISIGSRDLNLTDENAFLKLDKMIDPNTIVYFCSGIKKQLGDSLETYSTNLGMVYNFLKSKNLLESKKFVYLSSAEVYGENIDNLQIDERFPMLPTSYYGMSKKHCEELIRLTFRKKNFENFVLARMPLVYGHDENQLIYGPSGFVKNALAGKTQIFWGDGHEKRNFLYIEDLIDVLVHLADTKFTGVLNIANTESNSFVDITNILHELGLPLALEQRLRTKQKVDQGYNVSLLRKIYPNFEAHSLKDGMKKLLRIIDNSRN